MAGEFCKGVVAWAGVVVAWDVEVVALTGGLAPLVDLVDLPMSATRQVSPTDSTG